MSKFLVMLSLIILTVFGLIYYVVQSSLPSLSGEFISTDVTAMVEISRDEHGIPSIVGENELDVFYAQGYVHAQDRMFQMVLMKHMFLGRMSEIFGEKTVKVDHYMRYLNVEECIQGSYEKLSQHTKDSLQAYAKGVNRYLAEKQSSVEQRLLGFTVDPWRPEDSLVIQKAMAFDLSRDWPLILKNTALAEKYGNDVLDEIYPYESIVEPSITDEDLIKKGLPYANKVRHFSDGPSVPNEVVSSFEAFATLSHNVLSGLSSDDSAEAGSNIWAVGKTDTGMPYLANDPHLSYRVPNMFYLVHLKASGLNLTGGSIPGAPGIIIGRNEDISWGFTNGKLAQSDVFYGKNIKKKRKREETIKVAKGEDITVNYYDTDYGVLISEEGAPYDVTLNWTSFVKDDVTLDAIYGFNRSTSIADTKKYMSLFQTPAQNFSIIDNQGNYALFALGKVPIRKHSGRIAVPATRDYQWKNTIPTTEMPFVENPDRGYVMNANNDVVSRHYGYNASRLEFDNLRAVRLVKMLQEKDSYSLEDMSSIQMDNEDQKWMLMKDAIMKTKPDNELEQAVLDALKDWDGQAVKTSYEITIFSSWMREIGLMLYQDISIGLPKWAKPQYSDLFVRNSIQKEGRACLLHVTCDELLSKSLKRALKGLKQKFGTDDITQWTWDKSHSALFRHPIFKKIPLLRELSTRSVKINGARDTLNRSRWLSSKNGFKAIEGACLRMISNSGKSFAHFSMPMGESGNIFSGHYDDLLSIWAEGEYLSLDQTNDVHHLITIYPN
jgi:penicillin amidase